MPPAELAQLIVNGSPLVSIVAMFLWYLTKLNKLDQIKTAQLVRALQGVGNKVVSVDQKVDKVKNKVDSIHKDHQEDRETIKKMYDHSLILAKKAGVYVEG